MKKIIAFLIILMLLPVCSIGNFWGNTVALGGVSWDAYSIQAMQNVYKAYGSGKAVDGVTGNFGAYEAYILSISGAEPGTWSSDEGSLKDRVLGLIDETIAAPDEMTKDWAGNDVYARSAKRIAAEYIAAKNWNENDRAGQLMTVLQGRQSTSGNGSFDGNAFSDLPALEMLGRAGALAQIDTAAAITYVLGDQDAGTKAWSSSWNDIQATAQAIRALKYLEPLAGGQTAAVQTAIDEGKTWLQARQQANGGFLDDAGWDDPLIDTAEVILTLNVLGIAAADWNAAGISALDYMQDHAQNADKTFGTSENLVSDIWALDSYRVLGGNVAAGTVLGLNVTPSQATVLVGNTEQYTAEAFRMDGTKADVSDTATWTTGDNGVATVNDTGLATAAAAGTTTVNAAAQGVLASADIVVSSWDAYSIQAMQNVYKAYGSGKAVDGVTGNFGAYEAYILSISGAEPGTWSSDEGSLKDRVLGLIDETIAAPDEMTKDWAGNDVYARSAKRIAAEYIAAKNWNENDRAGQLMTVLQGRQSTSGNGSFDGNAFSDLPALEMLGRAGALAQIDTAAAITYVLGDQDAGTKAWSSSWNDIQATAQAIRALKYLEPLAGGQTAAVQTAIDEGKTWLQARQQANGGFLDDAGWDDPLIDTAEVILTLNVLGIAAADWNAAGISALDYMQDHAQNADKTFGTSKNLVSDIWALDSYRALGGNVAAGTVLGLNVTPSQATVLVGNTEQYTAEAFRMDGTKADVSDTATWTTGDNGVATVNDTGLATAAAAGTTTVNAAAQGVLASADIVVSGGGGGAPIPQGTPVGIRVVGKSGETLYAQNTVYLQSTDRTSANDLLGITPAGALEKTGLSYQYDSAFYVTTIANQTFQGMNGWMYKVNGASPGVSAFEYTLNANDQVLWFYSTDASNIAGISSGAVLPTAVQTAAADDLIAQAIEQSKQAVSIELQKRPDMAVEVSLKSIQTMTEAAKEMIIKNEGIELLFAPQAFSSIGSVGTVLSESKSEQIKIGAREISQTEKEAILSKTAPGKLDGFVEVGSRIFDLTADVLRSDDSGNTFTEKISGFAEPVRVTVDLSGIKLSEEDIAKLTAIRYETDEFGMTTAVKLGGSYDRETKSLSFYTEHFSYYGILKAEKLTTISMGINMLSTTLNGQRSYTDVPPVIINGRTMVPLRFIAENFGAAVSWNDASRTAGIELDGQYMILAADEADAGMDVPPTISNGRLLVPLRFISETLGSKVTWFPASQRIEIVR